MQLNIRNRLLHHEEDLNSAQSENGCVDLANSTPCRGGFKKLQTNNNWLTKARCF